MRGEKERKWNYGCSAKVHLHFKKLVLVQFPQALSADDEDTRFLSTLKLTPACPSVQNFGAASRQENDIVPPPHTYTLRNVGQSLLRRQAGFALLPQYLHIKSFIFSKRNES